MEFIWPFRSSRDRRMFGSGLVPLHLDFSYWTPKQRTCSDVTFEGRCGHWTEAEDFAVEKVDLVRISKFIFVKPTLEQANSPWPSNK